MLLKRKNEKKFRAGVAEERSAENTSTTGKEQARADMYSLPTADLASPQFGRPRAVEFAEISGVEGMGRKNLGRINPTPMKCQARFSGIRRNSGKYEKKPGPILAANIKLLI